MVILILLSLAVPLACAAVPDNTRGSGPVLTSPDLTLTGTNIANNTIPARYEITPTLINIRVEVSETSLPAPKGEMAAGPRSIGFSSDPVALAILIIAIIGGIAGIWYLAQRRPEVNKEEDE